MNFNISPIATYLPTALPGMTNGVTPVTILTAPSIGYSIQLKSFILNNADTVANTITIKYLAASPASSTIGVWTLQPNDSLCYEDGSGWYTINSSGAIKQAAPSGALLRVSVIAQGTTTYTPGAGCNNALFKLQAAGGGGGGANTAAVSAAAGGGGSAGSYLEKYIPVSPSTTYTVAVGSGGTAGIASGGTGGIGGVTTVTVGGTTYTANGGLGGIGSPAGTTISAVLGGGSPAISTNGDVNTGGSPGSMGLTMTGLLAVSGFGGSCLWGDGGNSSASQGAGKAGIGFGAGGGGACCINGGTAVAGAAGKDGRIVIEEYS